MDILGFSFLHPLSFALLLLVPFVLWKASKVGATSLSPKRKVWLAVIRAAIVAIVILALAAPRAFLPGEGRTVLFVVDVSESAGKTPSGTTEVYLKAALDSLNDKDKVGLILFGENPSVAALPGDATRTADLPQLISEAAGVNRASSDPARALRLALASFPPGGQRRVVLFTDGNETEGDLAAVADEAREQGIEVAVIPLEDPSSFDVALQNFEITTRAAGTTETIEGRISLSASAANSGKIEISLAGKVIESIPVTVTPGQNGPYIFQHPVTAEEGGDLTFIAKYVGQTPESNYENNRGLAYVNIAGRPRILILAGDPAKQSHLQKVLEAEDFIVEMRGPSGVPNTMSDLTRFDAVALVDLPYKKNDQQLISEDQDKLFASYAKDFGGGLIMLGGDGSFGPGGWEKTAVSAILPVDIDGSTQIEEPTLAVAFVLDRSGSMAEIVDGSLSKLELADQAAVAAMQTLSEDDFLAVAEVDTQVYWTVPLQPVKNKEAIKTAILSIRSTGGGIYVYTGVEAAYEKLKSVEAGIKHVILFTDTADSEEQCKGVEYGACPVGENHAYMLAERMVRDRITLSVIGIGHEGDPDTEFDRQLARHGKGRFYITSDARDLRRIFLQETRTVGGTSLDEFAFTPIVKLPSPIIKGIDFVVAPQLLGMVQSKAKETAETILVAPSGNPLLATWRYGLGVVAAFTSDANDRWAKNWITWEGYSRFWTQGFRTIARRRAPYDYEAQVSINRGVGTLTVDVLDAKQRLANDTKLQAELLFYEKPGGTPEKKPLTLRLTSPGQFVAKFPATKEGTYVAKVSSPEDQTEQSAGATISYPPEFARTGANMPLLTQVAALTGGPLSPSPEESIQAKGQAPAQPLDLWPWLLLFALLLLPLDVAVRRVTRSNP